MRIVIINGPFESGELIFDPEKVKDSEALHQLLCQIYPGDEYDVSFKVFKEKCDHSYFLYEVGTIGCGYGCKIVRCEKCGEDFPTHSASYGCPQAN